MTFTASLIRLRTGTLCGAVLLIFTACFGKADARLATLPSPAPDGVPGTYCYRGPYENVTPDVPDAKVSKWMLDRYPNYQITRRESGFTVLPLRDVYVQTPVTVTRRGDQLDIRYRRRASEAHRTLTWQIVRERNGVLELELPNPRGGAALGIGWSRRWAEAVRGPDGRLALVEHYRERGLGLLVIPFQDHLVWRMDLDPAERCPP